MATRLVPNLRTRYFDSNGKPLAGGMLYSYVAGTSTPLATYTDSTGSTPNANPVVLDANGEADVWVGGAIYKFVLTDSLGVTQWTEDQVNGNLSTATNGIDGKSVRNGVIAPLAGVGNDGDFYINSATWTVYGPKASGAWPAGVSMIGPAGSSGTAVQEKLTGTFASGNTTYTLSHTPLAAAQVLAILGAVPQAQGSDYTISGATITFTAQDTTSEQLLVLYRY